MIRFLALVFTTSMLAAAQSPQLAVIDLETALQKSQALSVRYEALQAELDQYNAGFNEIGAELKKLETRLSMTAKDDPVHDQIITEMETKKTQLKVSQKLAQERLEAKKGKDLQEVTAELLKHLEGYCNEQGIDIVLRTGADSSESRPLAGLQVLYANPQLDITEAFVAYANARFTPPTNKPVAPVVEPLGGER